MGWDLLEGIFDAAKIRRPMVVAARELLRQPRDIAVLPTGEVMVWSWTLEGFYLDAYDAKLALLWTRDMGRRSLGMSVDGNGCGASRAPMPTGMSLPSFGCATNRATKG